MSYHLQTANDKVRLNIKRHRQEYLSQKSLRSKHYLQSCTKPKRKNRITRNSTLPRDNPERNLNQIFSTYPNSLASNGIQSSFSFSKSDENDDTKSESSIEYPLSTSHPPRRVSLATIYLQDQQWQQLELFIKHFSSCVSLSNNLNITSSTTHLLIDDSSIPFQCTFSKKIFQAVARRVFVVSIRWIEECLIRNEILDETPFEIHGDGTMKTMHLARQSPARVLFPSSWAFLVDCQSFQRVFTRLELVDLLVLSGAILFESKQRNSTKILIILVEPSADRSELMEKYKHYHRTIKFLTPGFLLKSIIYRKQQPFEDFEL